MFYHVTLKSLLPNIIEKGLVPMIGLRSALLGESEAAIYCFPSIEDCEDGLIQWLGDQLEDVPEGEVVILELDIPAHIPRKSDVEYEVAFLDIIPANCIAQALEEDLVTVVELDGFKKSEAARRTPS